MSEELEVEDDVTEEFILDVAGEEGLRIVEELMEEDNVTDEDVAENVDFDLNKVRKLLYKLYDNGLADYSRSRDEKSGWITYNWRLTLGNVDQVLRKRKKDLLEELEERLEFEKNNVFYVCPDQHTRFTFEEASDGQFRCPECDQRMVHYENNREIEEMKNRIEELKDSIDS